MTLIWIKISKPSHASIPICQCNKCHWVWLPKSVNMKARKKKPVDIPKCCAHCKTPVWNKDPTIAKKKKSPSSAHTSGERVAPLITIN